MKIKRFLLLGILIFIIGCKEKSKEKIEMPVDKPSIVKDVELEKWKEEINKKPYVIDIEQIKNPFITPKTYQLLTKKETIIPVELVGIMKIKNKKIALLQDPTKKGYIVKEGDKLGESTIREIGNNYIIIEESSENIFGQKTKKLRKIILKERL